MSKSQVATAAVDTAESSPEDVQTIVAENNVQSLLGALDDADGRAILDATSEEARSAKEISEICDLPLSTAYRKLDMLMGAGLLEKQTRIRRSGKHANEYCRVAKRVTVSLGSPGETKLQVSQRDDTERACTSVATTEE